jgi:hypothetical protein
MSRMTRMMLVFVTVCALPSWAMAQDEAFKRGLEARGDKKWADVIRQMQSAIKSDDRESTRKVRSGFLGVQGMEYLPHYFLGEGFYNQNDCAGAVTEWSLSEQHGAIKSRPEFVTVMQKGLQACAAKGVLLAADYAPLYQSTLRAYTDATSLAKKLSDMGSTHKDVWRAEADEQYGRARKELENSLSRLNAGQRSRLASDFNESRAAADRATNILRPLENTLNTAVDTLSSVQRQSRDVEQLLTGADATNEALEAVKSSLTEPMQNARKSSRDQLTQARERLAVGQKTQNPAAVAEALRYAQTASTTLNQLLEQAKKTARGAFEQQFRGAMVQADEAFSRVSAAMSALDRRSAMRPEVVAQIAPERAALEKQVETLRRRFERARKAEDLSSLTETVRVTSEVQVSLDALIKQFGPVSLRDRGIRQELEDGVRLYLEGEYQKALAALEPLAGQADVPLQVHAHVFRAASLYALYVRSGETNQQLRTQALAEIAQSKQLNSSFQPSERAFSPRFLSLYQTGGAASSPAAGGAATPQ